jgi:hypothetical protein
MESPPPKDSLVQTGWASTTREPSATQESRVGSKVVGIGGRKSRHPDRLAIRPVLEQHIQIPILDLAKYEVRRPVPRENRR